jgi:hypothetical protein
VRVPVTPGASNTRYRNPSSAAHTFDPQLEDQAGVARGGMQLPKLGVAVTCGMALPGILGPARRKRSAEGIDGEGRACAGRTGV